jgi:hypothetical protein
MLRMREAPLPLKATNEAPEAEMERIVIKILTIRQRYEEDWRLDMIL